MVEKISNLVSRGGISGFTEEAIKTAQKEGMNQLLGSDLSKLNVTWAKNQLQSVRHCKSLVGNVDGLNKYGSALQKIISDSPLR